MGGLGGLERLLIEANYYDIDIDAAMQAPDAQDLLNGCIDTLEALLLRRDQSYFRRHDHQHRGALQNIGGIETDGIDINFDLTTVETGIGGFRFQWLTSLLLSYDELFANPAGGFDRVDRKGFELGSPTRGFVETKSTLNTDWFCAGLVRRGSRSATSAR